MHNRRSPTPDGSGVSHGVAQPVAVGVRSDVDGAAADAQHIVTANGTFTYDADWNGIERAAGPTVAAVRLLHLARQRTDTSSCKLSSKQL